METFKKSFEALLVSVVGERGLVFLKDEKGQTLTEYILVLVLIIVGFLIILSLTGFQEILDAAVVYIKSKIPAAS